LCDVTIAVEDAVFGQVGPRGQLRDEVRAFSSHRTGVSR
jgi:1,4-dihydroxy-2-naphthoyl-CoA synthase